MTCRGTEQLATLPIGHTSTGGIHAPHSRRIHFARFGILTDPDRGPGCERLLYSATYDGDLDSHLAELMSITSDLDAIWGRCHACCGAASFGRFIRAHAFEPSAFYIAFRDETEVFFNAYPEETVLNMTNDLECARAC